MRKDDGFREKCVICGEPLPIPHHPFQKTCSKECQKLLKIEKDKRKIARAQAKKKEKLRGGTTRKVYPHSCVDCGSGCEGTRCPTCEAKWRFRYGTQSYSE